MSTRPPLQPRSSSSAAAGAAAYPPASVARMILSPFIRLFRRIAPPGLPTTMPSLPTSTTFSSTTITSSSSSSSAKAGGSIPLILAFTSALQRLDLSRDPRKTLRKLSRRNLTVRSVLPYAFFTLIALYCLYIMRVPILLKLVIPSLYILAILLPITSQLIWPATPVLTWVILFFSTRFIPSRHRPTIHVALLPALESVLYGANISDLQTRYTNPIMDVMAWLPYGVGHFSIPVFVALVLWAMGPKGAAQYWGKAFGWMNLLGVMTQVLFPCAAPWYEIIHGLTPADYSMPGSPGGLLRIDRVLHTSTYTNAFGAAPLVFGAFPSLHSGCAVMEALFLSHFFPAYKHFYWAYVGLLWWATMYLSHHYLIDLTAGACLSVVVFYVTMPEKFKDIDQIIWGREEGGVGMADLDGHDEPPMFHATMGDGPMDSELTNGESSYGARGTGQKRAEEHGDTRGDFESRLDRLERSEVSDDDDGDIGAALSRNSDEEARMALGPGGKTRESPRKPKRNVSWGETKVLGEDKGRSPDLGDME